MDVRDVDPEALDALVIAGGLVFVDFDLIVYLAHRPLKSRLNFDWWQHDGQVVD